MDNVVLLLKKYLEKEEDSTEFERGLVFLDVLDFISSVVSKDKRALMVFTFSKIQKTFLSFKEESSIDKERELIEVEDLYDSLDVDLQFYLSISYLPMRAYYYYSILNYQLALNDLKKCIDNSHIILKENLKLETLVKCEQILNMFKVYLKSGDTENANIYAKELIIFSVYNTEIQLLKKFDIGNIKVNFYWTSHIVDSIFTQYLLYNSLEDLINLIDVSTIYEDNITFHFGLIFLKAYYKGNFIEAKKYVEILFKISHNNILPDVFLYAILSKLELMLHRDNEVFFLDYQCVKNNFIAKSMSKNKKLVQVVFGSSIINE